MRWQANRHAAAAVLLLGSYLQLVEWVDFFPRNDVRRGNGQGSLDLILGAATIALAGSLWLGRRWAAVVATLSLSAWAWLQALSWWIPYFRGPSAGWRRTYERWFDETLQVLPRDANHLPPDANHLVLQFPIVLALAVAIVAVVRGFRRA